MKLYHHEISGNSRRVKLVAAHLGIQFSEETRVELAKPEDRAALKAVNPNGKIPVLVDGDFVLWESHAIMQYLCDKTPGQTLYPVDVRARADVNRWLFWVASHLAAAVFPINFERLWKKFTVGGEADPQLVARYENFFHAAAGVLEGHLAARSWVVGDALSLADFSIAATLMHAAAARLPLEPYAHVRALLTRVHELPAWRATEPVR